MTAATSWRRLRGTVQQNSSNVLRQWPTIT